MIRTGSGDDLATAAAIAVLAMCLVTVDHEVLGHGSACLAAGGRIRVLTSSIFRCDGESAWIAPAGPFGNLLGGVLALWIARLTPHTAPRRRWFWILVASLSFFWEAGYAIEAMRVKHGDLYFAALEWFGEPALWWRIAGAAAGVGLYGVAVRWTARSLLGLWPQAAAARRAARTAWIAVCAGAGLAAAAYSGPGWGDLKDAVLEIGVSSVPLLFIPTRDAGPIGATAADSGAAVAPSIQRSLPVIGLAAVVFAVFVVTLGRGLRF
jgi:hypothetical protein